ncbi:hypothetical protein DPMN_189703 [Dreissena polymorpha]|uniref:Uncharacterized protein n=1 Tax=Dreissena polymorpha TaxID=45954 RepID=A0A9D4ICG2_DREPO|nr:hypothetical protein DPMN_189703 [Dreissena polymorpha]
MYLPTPITMPGARRIEVGNHSFLTLAAHEPGISEQVPTQTSIIRQYAPHGARTFDLPIPRRTPYPLGHGDRFRQDVA